MIPKAVIAVAAVVILVAGGAGAFILLNKDKSDSETEDLSKFNGWVYGNANGDHVVDSTDIELIQKVIDGTEKKSDYPLADSNHDGTVDQADIDLAKKIMNREPATVYIHDSSMVVPVKFPIGKIFAAGGTNMRVLIQVLDLEEKMTAVATTSYTGQYMDYTLYNKIQDSTITEIGQNATKDDFKKLNQIKQEKGLDFVVVENRNVSGYQEDESRAIFKDLDVDLVALDMESLPELKVSLSTMGILIGKEAKAKQMVDILDGTLKSIIDKTGEKYGKSTVMCITMSNSVSGTDSDYFKMTELAGGKNLADWSEKTRKFDKGDTWLLQDKYNPQFLFQFKSITYGNDVSSTDLDQYREYFKETSAYKAGHYYLINGVVPVHVRLAWMAQIMYPDEIESNWSDTLFQQYLDLFGDLNEGKSSTDPGYFSVTDHAYHWTVA